MAKDIHLLMTASKQPFLTKTVLRNTLWNSGFIVLLYLLLNVFFGFLLKYEATRIQDKHLEHELEHFNNAIHMEGDSLVLDNPVELRETDLILVSENSYFLQVYTYDGNILFQSPNLELFGGIPIHIFPRDVHFRITDVKANNKELRVAYIHLRTADSHPRAVLQLATIKPELEQFMPTLVFFSLMSFPVVVLLVLIISAFLAKNSFRPINNIINLAERLSATEIHERLNYEADPEDELGRLRDTLNSLFDRLQQQIGQISQFTDNASHQLMSPLTVLKSELEFLMRKPHDNSECLDTFGVMRDQTERMIKIVRTLLILAKECDICQEERSVFNLTSGIAAVEKLFASDRLKVEAEKGLYLRGNGEYFNLVIQNLIDNAIKYSEPDTPVKLSAYAEAGKIVLQVCDQGIGIAPELRDKIFERFYRGAGYPGKRIEGFGLGLSLVQAIVLSMGGEIAVVPNQPKGTCFRIHLPALSVS